MAGSPYLWPSFTTAARSSACRTGAKARPRLASRAGLALFGEPTTARNTNPDPDGNGRINAGPWATAASRRPSRLATTCLLWAGRLDRWRRRSVSAFCAAERGDTRRWAWMTDCGRAQGVAAGSWGATCGTPVGLLGGDVPARQRQARPPAVRRVRAADRRGTRIGCGSPHWRSSTMNWLAGSESPTTKWGCKSVSRRSSAQTGPTCSKPTADSSRSDGTLPSVTPREPAKFTVTTKRYSFGTAVHRLGFCPPMS